MRRGSIIALILSTITLSLVATTIIMGNVIHNKQLISKGFFSDSSIRFVIGRYDDKVNLLERIYLNADIDEFILYDISNSNKNATGKVGVLLKNFKPKQRIEQGRFFTNSDFFQGEKVAVVGTSKKKLIFSENDVQYIQLYEESYKVIGILEEYNDVFVDNTIYYNLDSRTYSRTLFQIESLKADKTISNFLTLCTYLPVQKINYESNDVSRYSGSSILKNTTIWALIFVILIASILKVAYVINQHKKTTLTLFILGTPKIKMLFWCLNQAIMCEILSVFICIFCFALFKQNVSLIPTLSIWGVLTVFSYYIICVKLLKIYYK